MSCLVSSTFTTATPLGLVSNGNSYPADRGLEAYLSFTVFAADHGMAKPDPGS